MASLTRPRVEFLDIMNRIVDGEPERQIHVILDNLKTHKPKRDLWLARHKNVPLSRHADPPLLAAPPASSGRRRWQ